MDCGKGKLPPKLETIQPMKFLMLTDPAGNPVYVNPSHLVVFGMTVGGPDKASIPYFQTIIGTHLCIETPSEIHAAMQALESGWDRA